MNSISKDIYTNLDLLPIDLQGWNGYSQVFEKLINETLPSRIIEVGTWKGLSAINMGNVVKKLDLNCTIFCIDTWLGAIEFWDTLKHTPERNLLLKNGYPSIYYQFLSNVVHSNLQDIIIPFPNTSLIAGRYFLKQQLYANLIYIDASHEYEDIKMDIDLYWNLLKEEGILFGDDYKSSWPGVKKAVNEFVTENRLKLDILESNYWVLRK